MSTDNGDDGVVDVRLQKLLAEAGIGSRRFCERLILDGRVSVDGTKTARLGVKAAPGARIELDGKPVAMTARARGGACDRACDRPYGREHSCGQTGADAASACVYIALNKPDGVITSASDQFGRKTVLDILGGGVPERVYPVGRLDYHTKGLLLLTNDGNFTYRATHPGQMVEKAYEVLTDRPPGRRELRALTGGVTLDDGFVTSPARADTDPQNPRSVTLVIHEGRNRQVRRMFAAVGLGVRSLTRVAIGGLALDDVGGRRLGVGEWRRVTRGEAFRVFAQASLPRDR